MVREQIDRTRRRAANKPYAVFIGDSIPHSDGYGKPSESLGALVDRAIPTVNLTSPSLAFPIERDLLRYVLEQTDSQHVIVEINPKWVVQSWTPEKFEALRNELDDEHYSTFGLWYKGRFNAFLHKLRRMALLEEPRDKIKYRLTNFTLYHYMSEGLKADSSSLWAPEINHEIHPTYETRTLHHVTPELLARFTPYHAMQWKTIDQQKDLNDLLALMAASKARCVAWLVCLNPEWGRSFGTLKAEREVRENLMHKMQNMGIRVVCKELDEKTDYQDDMHLTASGTHKMARSLIQNFNMRKTTL